MAVLMIMIQGKLQSGQETHYRAFMIPIVTEGRVPRNEALQGYKRDSLCWREAVRFCEFDRVDGRVVIVPRQNSSCMRLRCQLRSAVFSRAIAICESVQ